MFNKDASKKELEQLSNSSTIIGKGTILEGNIETLGNLRIEGKAIGSVKSKSKIALGDSSVVEGNIIAQNAEIAGEIKGSIEVSDLLILKSSAVIHGDILTNRIIIESGATFNGQCKMGEVKEIVIGEGNQTRKERTA
ncbi:MAG: polymer-forming cytoskeletal protein [Cytophagaceae bacterium]